MERLKARRVFLEEDAEAAFEDAYGKGWTDGLPIIPPTAARVERMMATVQQAPDTVVATLPPRNGAVTVERIAANAVMAGCRPDYLPVVVAAVEAIAQPEFNLYGINSTTSPVTPMLIVNGPVRHMIDLNGSYGFFGPGWRANATIGRAIRLAQLNIGGSIPGSVSKSTMAQPGRYSMCMAEYEERSPWPPLHVEMGHPAEESTVTVTAATSTVSVSDVWSRDAEGILTTMTSSMDWPGIPSLRYFSGQPLLILNPDHAAVCSRDGLSKEDVKRVLYERTSRIPLSRFAKAEQERLTEDRRVHDGHVGLVPGPEYFMVVVAGGHGGFHSTFVPTWAQSQPVTRVIDTRRITPASGSSATRQGGDVHGAR